MRRAIAGRARRAGGDRGSPGAPGGGIEPGSYAVVDGPLAGQGIHVMTAKLRNAVSLRRAAFGLAYGGYAGYQGSYDDVFPGHTWSAHVRGFLPDGRFDVRVNVTGKGFGKTDADSRASKVVVAHDCP